MNLIVQLSLIFKVSAPTENGLAVKSSEICIGKCFINIVVKTILKDSRQKFVALK